MARPASGAARASRRGAGIVVAVVAAAGSGTRLGGAVPKQFLAVAGRTILDHALGRLGRHPEVDVLVAVVPKGRLRSLEGLKRRHAKLQAVVAGGAVRQESVERGLDAAPGGDGAIVLVHDAARPLVSPSVVSEIIRQARRVGAAVPGIAPADTVKEVGPGGRVRKTLERARLRLIQTPQGFRASKLRRAYAEARRRGIVATDDASLVEAAGMKVVVVEGHPDTFKVTTPDDLKRLRGLLGPR